MSQSMTQIIEVTVRPDGSTRVETRGFFGQGCRSASQFLEVALGQRTGEQLTAAYYEQVPNSEPELRQQARK